MLQTQTRRPTADQYLFISLLLSCLLHIFFLWQLERPAVTARQATSIEVTLVPERPVRREEKKQIVTPPEKQLETKLPESDAFESEKNIKVEKQQIKRGMPESGPVLAKANPQQKPAQAMQPEQLQKPVEQRSKQQSAGGAKGLKLALNQQELLEQFKVAPAPEQSEFQKNTNRDLLMDYRAFSRPTGSGARFLGESGSADYLPNLPDGDITLLNTKANKFAVFVRRVATQVFSQLRSSGWQNLSAADLQAMKDFSVVRAVLSKQGKLISVQIEKPSGSRAFDLVLDGAVKKGAEDPHPPAEAAAPDGNIHFLFYARSWSRMASGRNGAVSERRWLLLATGLD